MTAIWLILALAVTGVATAIAVKAGWVVQREPSAQVARTVPVVMVLAGFALIAIGAYYSSAGN